MFSSASNLRRASTLDDGDIANAEATEINPDHLEVNVYRPQPNSFPRPTTDASTARFLFIMSGTIVFPASSPETVTSASPRRVRYNRDSLRATVIGTFRRGVDSVMRRSSKDAAPRMEDPSDSDATVLEALSDSDVNDALASDKRQANAGHTVYILPQTHSKQPSPVSETETEKTTSNTASAPIWDPSSSINVWPADCEEAATLESIRDACWLVEVGVPCSEIPTTWSSLEQLRKQAIHGVTLKMSVGL